MDTPPSTPSTPSRHSTSSEDSLPPSPIIDLGFDLGIDELLDEEENYHCNDGKSEEKEGLESKPI